MPKNKVLKETGKMPEQLTTAEREERVTALPQFQKHLKKMAKDDQESASYKSKQRIAKSNSAFLAECLNRGTLFNSSNRLYADIDQLKQECCNFVAFCIEHDFAMTVDSLATWLGVSSDFLQLAVKNPGLDERFGVLKNVRQIMDTILANEIMGYEGNAANKMFVAKCRFDWQEYPTTVNINVSSATASQAPLDVLSIVSNTPVDCVDVDYVNANDGASE